MAIFQGGRLTSWRESYSAVSGLLWQVGPSDGDAAVGTMARCVVNRLTTKAYQRFERPHPPSPADCTKKRNLN